MIKYRDHFEMIILSYPENYSNDELKNYLYDEF